MRLPPTTPYFYCVSTSWQVRPALASFPDSYTRMLSGIITEGSGPDNAMQYCAVLCFSLVLCDAMSCASRCLKNIKALSRKNMVRFFGESLAKVGFKRFFSLRKNNFCKIRKQVQFVKVYRPTRVSQKHTTCVNTNIFNLHEVRFS